MPMLRLAVVLFLLPAAACRSSSSSQRTPSVDEVPVVPGEPSDPTDPSDPDASEKSGSSGTPTVPRPTETPAPNGTSFSFMFAGAAYKGSVTGNGEILVMESPLSYSARISLGSTVEGSKLMANPDSYCDDVSTLVQSAKNGSANARDLVRNFKAFLLSANFFPVLSSDFQTALTTAAENARPGFSSYYWANRPKIANVSLEILTTDDALYSQLGTDSKVESAIATALTAAPARSSGAFKAEINASDLICDLVQNRATLRARFKPFDLDVSTAIQGM